MFFRNRFLIVMLAASVAILAIGTHAMAYIGPGAGLEYVGYGLGLIVMMAAAFLSMIMWPVYAALHWFRGRRSSIVADQSSAAGAAPCDGQSTATAMTAS